METLNIPSAFTALLVISCSCTAQTNPDSAAIEHRSPGTSVLGTIGNDGLTALKAAGFVLVAPARWEGTDWLLAGGVVGVTAAGFLLDNKSFDLMERNHSRLNDGLSDIAVAYGSGYMAVGLPVAMYISGLAFEERWLRETAMLMGSTVLLTSTITTVGKIAIGRARPYADLGRSKFRPFECRSAFESFPSGHTTTAFALSAVLAARIKNPWASMGLYGIATLTSVSRMYSRDHWLSDLVFSAAYSTAVAHSIVRWFEEVDGAPRNEQSLNITPTINGISVVWRF